MPLRVIERDASGLVIRLGWERPATPEALDEYAHRWLRDRGQRCPMCWPEKGISCPGCLRELEHELDAVMREGKQ